jgi:type IV fimbrial biogenesis protein FimT
LRASRGTRLAGRRAERGFTLVELVVTGIILAILAALSLSVAEMIQQNRIISGTGDVVAALGLARGEAILRRTQVSLCPEGGVLTSGWRIMADDPECDGSGSKAAVLFSRKEPLKALALCADGSTADCPASAPTRFVFTPLGRLADGDAAVTLCIEGRVEGRRIDISSAGQVKSRTATCPI